jgi:hypothetical protein
MPQIFHPSMDTISRATIFGAVFIVAVFGWLMMRVARSPYMTDVGVIKAQPVPFSHLHHVAECGIDCRYCHTSVEQSSFAGIPPTQTCINCHSYIWPDSPMLGPVFASYRDNRPLVWNRVHDVPDFAYFDHSVHVHAGVACVTCHGHVDRMPLMYRTETLHMEWCLNCHRQPEKYVGPRESVFASTAIPGDLATLRRASHEDDGELSLAERHFDTFQLTNCSTCHY